MMRYDIEIGEESSASTCKCCGLESNTGQGFVYRDGGAHAIYYVGWSNKHPKKKLAFALAIGKWEVGSSSDDRTCFGLEAYEGQDSILFRVIDPEESPWPSTPLMGEMITRNEGLRHRLLEEVFVIAEKIARDHTAVREYLGISAI